jgi:nicotinamidase-related amidase
MTAEKEHPFDPGVTAVIIIECQNGVVGRDAVIPALAEAAASTLPVIGRLAQGARDAGARVVHLTYVPVAGNRSSNRKPRLFGRTLAQMSDWGPDHRAAAVVDEIGVGPDDLVLPRHQGLSPTYSTETFKILHNLDVSTLVLAGVSTNIAVPIVAVEAVDEGFDVVIPSDAVTGTPIEHSRSMLQHTLPFIATITTVDDLLKAWQQ